LSSPAAPKKDIFLVFVDALPGHEQEYGSWFSGIHMKDMRRLSGVASAQSYRLATLDDQPPPATFGALYELDNARKVLSEIARLKGSEALPSSPLQGTMTWRIFETFHTSEAGQVPAGTALLLALIPTAREKAPPMEEILDLGKAFVDRGITWIRYTRLSELQPRRGSDFGWAVFARLPKARSVLSEVKMRLARLVENADVRFLKLVPNSE
jgi:hypothetical protein